MEPVTVVSLLMTIVLVVERLVKYCIKNTKTSKCCGSEVVFEYHGDSSNDLKN